MKVKYLERKYGAVPLLNLLNYTMLSKKNGDKIVTDMKIFKSCLFFVLGCLGTMQANADINNRWHVETWTLHTSVGYRGYSDYKWPEIYVDNRNRPIALSYFVFDVNDEFTHQIILFVFDKGVWVKSKVVLPNDFFGSGMIKDGDFYAYSVNFPPPQVRRAAISLYGLDSGARLVSEPIRMFEVETEKTFYPAPPRIIPLKGSPDSFFVIGQRRESRLLNPITFILFLTSAGHYGFIERPFGAIVERHKTIEYYDVPVKLKTNENFSIKDLVQNGDDIHCIGTKYKPYGSDITSLQYLRFDLAKKCWTEPVQLFQGHKYRNELFETISSPSLACDGNDVYCTWSWNVRIMINNEYVFQKETGIYFCNKVAGQWNKPVKLADSGWNPQVLVDNNEVVHIIWSDDRGLCHKAMTTAEWTETELVFEDKMISININVPPSIGVDKDNNLYISYVRRKELVCLKLSPSRKLNPEP